MKKVIALIFLLSAFCGTCFAEQERPSVALVLAGGGARGFAHIPVIELIEELGIPIDMVIGTSAGAIMGGMYSAGYTGNEIADLARNLNWTDIFNDTTTSYLEDGLGSHSSKANFVSLNFTDEFDLDLGKGLLTGQKVYDELKKITAKIPSYIHFDSLITPFRAAAVDLITGELVIFEQGDLAEAIRSSMSIPGVFEPFPIDGHYYIDGFTRNNLPIQVAKDLGYDIIIAVELTARLTDDLESFESNPITVFQQVISLQQIVVVEQGYEHADLVLHPEIYEFSEMDYDKADEVYAKGKSEAEKYRPQLIEIRNRIFPEFEESEQVLQVEESTDDNFAFTFYSKENSIPYERATLYHDLAPLTVATYTAQNILPSDEELLEEVFAVIKDTPISQNEIEFVLDVLYETGKYVMVTARIDYRNGQQNLVLEFHPKASNTIDVAIGGNFEGTLSDESTWALNLRSAVQFRGLNDLGGMISVQGSVISESGVNVLYFQPITKKVFTSISTQVRNTLSVVSSGLKKTDIKGFQLRDAFIEFGCGIFFAPNHRMLNQIGFRWIDTNPLMFSSSIPLNTSYKATNFSADAMIRYTFSNLDFPALPTKGFYTDLRVKGVVPLTTSVPPMIFDLLSNDFLTAIPLSKNASIIVGSFVGTTVTQGLLKVPNIASEYGFTLFDRNYFPHVTQKYIFGLHKAALKVEFQFSPPKPLTILGGQVFFGFGGSVGDVWLRYDDILAIDSIEWQTSGFGGLRIKDSIGLKISVGAGSNNNSVAPFISLDLFVNYY